MNLIFQAAKEVADFMAERGWKFCLIGGLAVEHWGEPRATLDADFTVLSGFDNEEDFIKPILERFESRIPNGEEFALTRRVLLVRTQNGTGVDISLGATPFESDMIEHAPILELAPGIQIPCCTAEDLLVMKLVAGRPKDMNDANTIVARQQSLDVKYIRMRIDEMCKLSGSREIMDRAQTIFKGML
ncbi:nucleotidyl transferase AbiEii/AbiGii toxin family protein [bacterium]|nr:nucleotidyl transferase AbiEii/AbiGii toxin family protein [bacterium]